MNRLEKTLKKELEGNDEAVQSMMNCYNASIDSFIKDEEKDLAKADANIQKILTGIANEDPDTIISNLYQQLCEKEEAIKSIGRLEDLRGFIFEEIQERKVVHGLKKK